MILFCAGTEELQILAYYNTYSSPWYWSIVAGIVVSQGSRALRIINIKEMLISPLCPASLGAGVSMAWYIIVKNFTGFLANEPYSANFHTFGDCSHFICKTYDCFVYFFLHLFIYLHKFSFFFNCL